MINQNIRLNDKFIIKTYIITNRTKNNLSNCIFVKYY